MDPLRSIVLDGTPSGGRAGPECRYWRFQSPAECLPSLDTLKPTSMHPGMNIANMELDRV